MKRISVVLIGFLFVFSAHVKADEGMWLLSLLKQQEKAMQEMGFELSAENVYSINNSSMKDAMVGLGNEGAPFWHFCTGEIISNKGLFLTNHHCGFGKIQAHSTPEHNYLEEGFWAYSLEEELPNPGMTASILVRMEDVTEKVLSQVNDTMTQEERDNKIDEIASEIEKKAIEGTQYSANVRSMFEGNKYFLFVHIIYNDVRLVGAPPSSMGKYGGDTDNWMWPRHTADFSMFRIYTAPDGSPAAYSEDNVPLKPKHHLPISIKGIEEGDFAMVMGFPGTTNRYLTSFGLKETMEITNANRYEIRTEKLKAMKSFMEKDAKINIQYASKYAGSANYWKYSNEQNKALRQLNTLGAKEKVEASYNKWANATPERKAKYGEALSTIENIYNKRRELANLRSYTSEALTRGAEMPFFASRAANFLTEKLGAEEITEEDIKNTVQRAKNYAEGFYKDYNEQVDMKMFIVLNELFAQKVSKENHPEIFNVIEKEYKGNFEAFAKDIYAKSVFSTQEKLFAFLENPNVETLKNDPAAKYGSEIRDLSRKITEDYRAKSKGLRKERRLFVDGLMNLKDVSKMAPDANSTIRLTYGKIGGYKPKDAVTYKYYTTLKGVMEKEDATNPEFKVPGKLKALYKFGDLSKYADKNGKLPTCFLTDNDITGGNSGSPVINARGELIGTAFDGNSEAMSGDIDFEENLQRCINLDIRYTLFIIDEFAGAKNLIDEMTIVK